MSQPVGKYCTEIVKWCRSEKGLVVNNDSKITRKGVKWALGTVLITSAWHSTDYVTQQVAVMEK